MDASIELNLFIHQSFVPLFANIRSKVVINIDTIDTDSQYSSLTAHADGLQLFVKIVSTQKQLCWDQDCKNALLLWGMQPLVLLTFIQQRLQPSKCIAMRLCLRKWHPCKPQHFGGMHTLRRKYGNR